MRTFILYLNMKREHDVQKHFTMKRLQLTCAASIMNKLFVVVLLYHDLNGTGLLCLLSIKAVVIFS